MSRRRGYGAAVVTGSVAATCVGLARRRLLTWGATGQESDDPLPGDELIPSAHLTSTRAITIGARADRVWPWIAQLGQGRGGFYSYDFLENLAGCDIHSADRIVPEWEEVRVGDEVRLAPEVALAVATVEPGRALVLRGGVFAVSGRRAPYDFTWAFALREQPGGATRLLVRERYKYLRWWAPLLLEPTALVSVVMSRKMLLGIRARAQSHVPAGELGSRSETLAA